MPTGGPAPKPVSAIADPRQAPLVGVDGHLPAVPMAAQTPQALRQRFSLPPSWSPEVVLEKRFSDRQPTDAAVLVPIVLRSEPTVLLTERTAHLSTHSGQVAFPGGKRDPEDASAEATALREAHEEVGLASGDVEVLGTLPIYTTGTAFLITPVVALVDPAARLAPNPYEVADVFEVPLAFLLNPAHHERHAMVWNGVPREWFAIPYQDGDRQRYIWGATAGMLRNLYRFLSA
ncbi:MAG: CoA pyrophosphatase [Burkholderiaceae bacterium]|jgi:8-oxo-dGTP pyrophosphatase MutT (NUDIX family)|nr:CoA pyrophosphatase [Burkholderiaceae bacterium]